MDEITHQQAQEMADKLNRYMIKYNLRRCTCCQASLSKSEHTLTKGMIDGLIKFADACLTLNVRVVNPRTGLPPQYRLTINEMTNWTKLRFFGLVAKYKVDGIHKEGKWVVTRNGWKFLKGDLQVPRYIKTFRNTIIEKSVEQISIVDINGFKPIFPSKGDFFFEGMTEDVLENVKATKIKKRRVKKNHKCPECTSGRLKKSSTAVIVNNLARVTYWLKCSNCLFTQKLDRC